MKRTPLNRVSKNKVKKKSKTVRISKVDKLFSDWIRERDGWKCQRCGKWYDKTDSYQRMGIHCSHFWGRSNKATRFDPQNAEALCYGCHRLWEGNKMGAYKELKIKQLGQEGYEALERKARSTYSETKAKAEALEWLLPAN